VEKFRHPIPTMKKIERYAMLVICAEHAGLISNCTRLIHFGPLPADLRMKQQAVCNVDTAVNLSTVPEKNLGEIFAILQKAYADNGFGDQWKLHHQGGSTGYANREVTATPASSETVVENQAFAWNPSITGVKSEDTVLATSSGIEVLTKCSTGWPMVVGHFEGRELFRPDILVK
jgi:Xaa-Pro aminopeptidase